MIGTVNFPVVRSKVFELSSTFGPIVGPHICCPGKPKPEFEHYRKIKVLVDSGAAENVLPPDLLPVKVIEGDAKKNNVGYTKADGNELPNLGELNVHLHNRTRSTF